MLSHLPASFFEGAEGLGKTAGQTVRHSISQFKIQIRTIRISFETRTDAEDSHRPDAWRQEAAARLCEIAKRIAAGKAIPLILVKLDGNLVGRAREVSYRPELPRKCAAEVPRGSTVRK